MSGLFGYFTPGKGNLDEKRIVAVTNAMKLEEYGIAEIIRGGSCILGKLGAEQVGYKQPIKQKGGINLAVCGEVYNEDIGDIDEWLRSLYQEGNLDLIKNLNGSFAAAIYDRAKEKLTLVNDRYGLIKVFYYRDGDDFCFAPKLRPLLNLGAKKSLRKDAIVDFFLFGYLLGDKTFFEHIHQLPPASILEVSKSDMKLAKYWRYEYDKVYDARPHEELIDELGALWQRAVERRIKKDEKIIIPLSGGPDSRAILAAALKCTPKDNIITFTFGEKGSFDFDIGKMVAERAGVKNIPLGVEKEGFEEQYHLYFKDTEGMCDATPFFPPNKYKKVSQIGTNIISGYMGDALMGDHVIEQISNLQVNSYDSLLGFRRFLLNTFALSSNNGREIIGMLSKEYFGDCSLYNTFDESLKYVFDEHGDNLSDILQKWEFVNLRYKYEMTNVLRFQHVFSYRCPLCDNELIDFMLRMPPELRVKERLYKGMLLKKYPELFGLPTKSNLGLRLNAGNISLFLRRAILFSKLKANKISTRLLKRNIFLDKNKNYIDYDDLLRKNEEYRDYIRNMIEKVEEREYFNKEYIERIWRLHMQGKKNYAMLFGLLVTFELFLERFGDG